VGWGVFYKCKHLFFDFVLFCFLSSVKELPTDGQKMKGQAVALSAFLVLLLPSPSVTQDGKMHAIFLLAACIFETYFLQVRRDKRASTYLKMRVGLSKPLALAKICNRSVQVAWAQAGRPAGHQDREARARGSR